ncbi:MAG: 3'-5' exonuclease [Symbiobacteriia bacterium]
MADAGQIAKLLGRPVVVLDTETTGLDPAQCRVIELAALRFNAEGQEDGQINAVLRLPEGVTMEPKITEITGITPEMAAAGEDRGNVLFRFNGLLAENPVLIAHNAPFDAAFVDAEMVRQGWGTLDLDFLDTVSLARLVNLPYPHKLADVAKRLSIPFDGAAHRAMNDLVVTAKIAARLYDIALGQKRPIINAICYNPKYPLPQRPNDRAIYYKWFEQKGA